MMEKIQTRRDFIRNTLTLGAGIAAMSTLSPVMSAIAEEEKVPFAWKPNAAPCQLIEELAPSAEGVRSFKFTTDGRSCSKSVTFDIVGKEEYVKNVKYEGGCSGGTQGIAAMSEGRTANEIIAAVLGLVCRNKKSGSGCADQLALGLQQALMIVRGTPCPGCEAGKCANAK
ncbi:MAG: TSCPD domain-containing protein [Clostridia bacterium]|nr:TSCPD domain-containing protein [Clostridia bacterium]